MAQPERATRLLLKYMKRTDIYIFIQTKELYNRKLHVIMDNCGRISKQVDNK